MLQSIIVMFLSYYAINMALAEFLVSSHFFGKHLRRANNFFGFLIIVL